MDSMINVIIGAVAGFLASYAIIILLQKRKGAGALVSAQKEAKSILKRLKRMQNKLKRIRFFKPKRNS
jgi:preprotein translocase subunit SecG